MAQPFRAKVSRRVNELLHPHYARREDVVLAIDELAGLLAAHFDAETEAMAVIGQRVAALTALVERMQDELVELRSQA